MSGERNPVFWDITPCPVVSFCGPFEVYQYIRISTISVHLHGPKDEGIGTYIVRYVGNRF